MEHENNQTEKSKLRKTISLEVTVDEQGVAVMPGKKAGFFEYFKYLIYRGIQNQYPSF